MLRVPNPTRANSKLAALLGGLALAGAHAIALPASGANTVPQEVGYGQGTIETGRSTAVGGADRALSNSLGALFMNPANMASNRVYHIGALVSVMPEADRQTYGAAAVDSTTPVAGGLGATYNKQDPNGLDRVWTDVRFALAYPFSEQFFMGVGGRYLWVEQNGLGPLGYSLASGGLPNGKIIRGIGLDAGVTIRPVPELSLALVGNNINDPGHALQPTTLGGGIGYGADLFTIEADAEADFSTWQNTEYNFMGGAGLLLADNYPVRAGYRFERGPRTHAVSAGIGYVSRFFGVELGVRRLVAGEEATLVTLDLRYHVEASGMAGTAMDAY